MKIEQMIRTALAYRNMSQSELAKRMGQTPSNLNQKIKRETLKQEELEQIATILNGKCVIQFVLDDGTVI